MSIQLKVGGKDIILEYYFGWSEPGRSPELNFEDESDLPIQILKICEFLQDIARTHKTFSASLLQEHTGYSPSAWRQVRPIMMKMGILNCRISENKKISSDNPVSEIGNTFNLLTKKRRANKENYHQLKEVHQMVWADMLMFYQTDNPEGLYPVRAILRAVERNGYLDRTEWDIMTTFIERNDDSFQEQIVDTFINHYRQEPELFTGIQRIPGVKKGPKSARQSVQNNRNTYWNNLRQAGLIKIEKKEIDGELSDVIVIDYRFEDIVNAILSNDFFEAISKGD
ncbi:hypothetical protein [Lysinibacillus antri]|uniref:Uncharacterized protein n=1 Tax=Lysinibacillus antri TaxID=2498145 RepID=A0A432LCQ1_9BACI|nr:hypothetical protein [Lysinibacillus antri]RUL53954.1 hypothetical protein EK386_07435 [Lysinibacillus antri]